MKSARISIAMTAGMIKITPIYLVRVAIEKKNPANIKKETLLFLTNSIRAIKKSKTNKIKSGSVHA